MLAIPRRQRGGIAESEGPLSTARLKWGRPRKASGLCSCVLIAIFFQTRGNLKALSPSFFKTRLHATQS